MTPAGRAVQRRPQHQVPLTRAAQSLAGSGDSKSGPCDGHSRLVVAEYQAGRAKPVDTVLPSGPGVGVPADRQGWSLGPRAPRALSEPLARGPCFPLPSLPGPLGVQTGGWFWGRARVAPETPRPILLAVCARVSARTHRHAYTRHTQAPGVGTGQRCRESVRGDGSGSPSQPQDGSQGPAHVSGRHLRPKPCLPQRWNATVRRQVAKVSLSRAWRQSP